MEFIWPDHRSIKGGLGESYLLGVNEIECVRCKKLKVDLFDVFMDIFFWY